MRRSLREAARQTAEARRQSKASRVASDAEAARKRLEGVQKALAGSKTQSIVDAMFDGSGKCLGFRFPAEDPSPENLRGVLRVVEQRAARLLTTDYVKAISNAYPLTPLRSIEAWEPRGKGRDTLFISLMEHLYAKFPMPPFIWSAFFDAEITKLRPVVGHVAAGGSLHEAVKTKLLPLPFTRRMCHEFMQTESDVRFLTALRRVQVRTSGGHERLLSAWLAAPPGRSILQPEDEDFWSTVLDWMARNPMLDPTQVGPLVDYIMTRRREDRAFSMKGRTVLALMRDMAAWHGDLAKTKNIKGAHFKPSGYRAGHFDRSKKEEWGTPQLNIWHVREILSGNDLAEEGRKMKHCVYSYASRVQSGDTSIWSMTRETYGGTERALTIEVQNATRRIVQARGPYNKQPSALEHTVLVQWAGLNNFTLSLPRW